MRSLDVGHEQFNKANQHIDNINDRLKAAGIRASIREKGGSLYIRFTAPPKPGCNDSKNRQYDHPVGAKLLSFQGRKKAEALAKEIGGRLENSTFTWADYLLEASNDLLEKSSEKILFNDVKQGITIREAVEIFTTQYFAGKEINPTTMQSFNNNCRGFLNRLQRFSEEQLLTPEMLLQVIEETDKNSCPRRDICSVFQRLSDWCHLGCNFLPVRGNYGYKNAKKRHIPSDEYVKEVFHKITHSQWQWVFGILVTYGLRPHEPFFADYDRYIKNGDLKNGDPLRILEGKTGPRDTFAYCPEWVEEFDLKNKKMPDVGDNETYSDYGRKCREHLIKYIDPPFTLYDFRHAWAVRAALKYSVKDVIAAKMMGHSLTVHTNIYLRWIDQKDLVAAYLKSTEKPNI